MSIMNTGKTRSWLLAICVILVVLLLAGITFLNAPRRPDAASVQPRDVAVALGLPANMTTTELGQWCTDHDNEAFKATLSQSARDFIAVCMELWGAGLTPGPTTSPTGNPEPSSPTPTSTPTPGPSVTTTPAPSPTVGPTVTPPPVTPPVALGFPTAKTTGVPAGWTPASTRTTNLVVTVAGSIIHDVRLVNADILVRAANVTIRRVEVQGGRIWADAGPCSNMRIEDSSVIRAPGQVTTFADGPVVGPAGYTFLRSKVDGLAEGLRASDKDHCGPVAIRDSFVRVFKPDNCNGDWHGDGIQGYFAPAMTVSNTTVDMVGATRDCDGTSPFFVPVNQGNTRVDIDGMLVKGGLYYAYRQGVPGIVRNLNIAGGYSIKCSVITSWQAFVVSVDSDYKILTSGSLPCNQEDGT